MITADEPDPSLQAAAANRFAATVYLGFEPRDRARRRRVATTPPPASSRSAAGRWPSVWPPRFDAARALPAAVISGMRLPVLRETRMPAVVCSVGPVQRIVDAAPMVSDVVVAALAAWAASPLPCRLTNIRAA